MTAAPPRALRRLRARLAARLRADAGQTIIEVLVAMVILTFAVGGLLGVFGASALSLARSGEHGTATVIGDNVMEYYRRAPFDDIFLLQHGWDDGAGGAVNVGGYLDEKNDSTYRGQCPNSCGSSGNPAPADASTQITDDTGATQCPNTPNDGSVGLGDVRYPPTRCLAVADVTGADNDNYRVYTYMAYGCEAGVAGSCVADTNTKVVTLKVRKVRDDGTVDASSSGLMYETSQVFNKQYYSSTCVATNPACVSQS